MRRCLFYLADAFPLPPARICIVSGNIHYIWMYSYTFIGLFFIVLQARHGREAGVST